LIVILSKPLLRREEPVPSEVEGIWASRAKCRALCDIGIAGLARFLFKLTHYQNLSWDKVVLLDVNAASLSFSV